MYCIDVHYTGAVRQNLCELGRTPLNVCLLCKSTQSSLSQKNHLAPGMELSFWKVMELLDSFAWQCGFLDSIMWLTLSWKLHKMDWTVHDRLSLSWRPGYAFLSTILMFERNDKAWSRSILAITNLCARPLGSFHYGKPYTTCES